MKNMLSCNIIRDMLPLYLENLASAETTSVIHDHLESCEACRDYLQAMGTPIDCPTAPKTEIDYMRKVNLSLKRRTTILVCTIATASTILLWVFLHFFIIGTPLSMDALGLHYEWHYDSTNQLYAVKGHMTSSDVSIRVKVYENSHSDSIQITLYKVMPSIFFPTSEFSFKIPWNGDKDIIWQEKDSNQTLMSSQYLSLAIIRYKDGNYQNLVNTFDLNGVSMIDDLYTHAEEASTTKLSLPFDELKYKHYIIISLPTATTGTFSVYPSNNTPLVEDLLDTRIFLYEESGQYYLYKQGYPLKKLSIEAFNKFFNYIEANKV